MRRSNADRMEHLDKRLTWIKIAEEAMVDCYNEYEVFSGWQAYLESKIDLPCRCRVEKKEGTLLGFDTAEPGLALLAIVEIDGNRHRLDATTVRILGKEKGFKYLEAFKKWV
jgi:hypothetical protein